MSPARRHLPPEWAPQTAVLLTWPHGDSPAWHDRLASAESVFESLAVQLARSVDLLITVPDRRRAEAVATRLTRQGLSKNRLRLALAPSDDVWVRDYGPVTVARSDGPAWIDFRFNGWGGKFPAAEDDALVRRLVDAGVCPDAAHEPADLVAEGGALETDGGGTLLTTASCLPSPSRNPGLSREGIAAELERRLGVERVLWLERGGLAGDDTDGHIDMLARFADPGTIVHQGCADPSDAHYDELGAMADELAGLRRPDGRPYRLIALPLPEPVVDGEGRRLPATYANFLITNGAVLVPVYRCPADAEAVKALERAFPERRVRTVDCRPLIEQAGSVHCVTMQLPRIGRRRAERDDDRTAPGGSGSEVLR